MPQTNQAGRKLIESFEGCVLTPYLDAVGVPTIGYGHTLNVSMTMHPITQAQADGLLDADLHIFEEGVNGLVTRSLTPNQFAALVSFAYNLGLGSLQSSTLLRLVNEGDLSGAAPHFMSWTYAGGQQLEGLVRRRQAEMDLFNTK